MTTVSKGYAFLLLLLTIGLMSASMAWAAGAPPRGVYGCYDVRMDYRQHMVITPMPVVMFGLIDAATYADFDGQRGHYTYDPAAEVLTFTDGPRQGWRYRKIDEWSFRLIDNNTGHEIYTCPLDASKDPTRGPW
jgi:hypothetical protein